MRVLWQKLRRERHSIGMVGGWIREISGNQVLAVYLLSYWFKGR